MFEEHRLRQREGEREKERMEESAGQWLEKALGEIGQKMETDFALDSDTISVLVSYCELAPPLDAKEYLDVSNFDLTFLFIYLFNYFKFSIKFMLCWLLISIASDRGF